MGGTTRHTDERPGAGRWDSRNADTNIAATIAHNGTEIAPPPAQTAVPARPHVTGLIQGPARRMAHWSQRHKGHDASGDAGILRSGSVLNGNSKTSPRMRNTNEPAWASMNRRTQKKL